MPTISLTPPSGRYLSFTEREEIALLRASGASIREIARKLERAPSTVSRELRRNAATRCGELEYRPSVAHWKAEFFAHRPRPAKLTENDRLRGYVQERITHTVEKYIGRRPAGHVRIEKEHGEFRTNCTIHLWQGMSLEAHGVAPDAYRSADLACERLDKRVRRYTRRVKRHGGSARQETPAVSYVLQPRQEGHEERGEDEDNPVIIAEAPTSCMK